VPNHCWRTKTTRSSSNTLEEERQLEFLMKSRRWLSRGPGEKAVLPTKSITRVPFTLRLFSRLHLVSEIAVIDYPRTCTQDCWHIRFSPSIPTLKDAYH